MIYIVMRRTTDWGDRTRVDAQLPEGLKAAVSLWDATFKLPYHVFRRELARIAHMTRSQVAGAACVSRTDVPPGALLVPTDDDDWFAPGLSTALKAACDDRYCGYYWPSRFIEVPISLGHELGLLRRAIFPHTAPKWLCTTNNYALTMNPAAAALIDNHMIASRWFLAHPAAVRFVPEPLSVMNRTLASQTSLGSVHSPRQLVKKYLRYRRLYRGGMPTELGWCERYVAMMRDLMDDLTLRVRA